MKHAIPLAALATLLAPALIHAQDREPDYQQWVQVFAEGNLDVVTEGLRLAMDIHARRANAPQLCMDGVCQESPNTLLIFRPSVGYSLGPKATFSLGYAWVPNLFDDADVRATRNFREHRIWEQYQGRFVFGRADLTVRTRVEQRFRSDGPGKGDVGHRLRQLLRFSWTLVAGKPYQLIVADELFLHLNETAYRTEPGVDQNRAFVGVGYQATSDLRVELGYMNVYVHRYTDAQQINHVFATNVNVRFGFAPPPASAPPPPRAPEPIAPENEPAVTPEPTPDTIDEPASAPPVTPS